MDIRQLYYTNNDPSRELGDTSGSSSSTFWNTWTDEDRHNATGTNGEQYSSGDDTATVLVLAVLLFLLVSISIACVRLREAQYQQSRALNQASDGRTVASAEDQKDVEEGNRSKETDVPIIVVVVEEGGNT